jgi:hypothetical protein
MARSLERAGALDAARAAAVESVKASYATEQRSERAASDVLLATLSGGDETFAETEDAADAAGTARMAGHPAAATGPADGTPGHPRATRLG